MSPVLINTIITKDQSITVYFCSKTFFLQDEFEDTKGVIRICKLKKNRQYNGQTQITKDWAKRTQLETGGEFMWSGRVRSSCSASDTRGVTLITRVYVNFIYKIIHRKQKFEQSEHHWKLRCSGRVSSSCSTSEIRRVTLVKKLANINKRNNHLPPQIIEHKKEI